jgi:hypothetical protein
LIGDTSQGRAAKCTKKKAPLRDHLRDVDGRKRDIVVLGHNVAQVRAQMESLRDTGRCHAVNRF